MEDTNDTKLSPTEKASGNPKKVIFVVVIILLIFIAGYFGYMYLGKKNTQQDNASKAATNVPSPTSAGIISSIKDVFSKSASMECKYVDDEGRTTATYVKAGAIRTNIEAKTPSESGSVIIKDNKMYYWTDNQGMMMEFDLSEVIAKITPGMEKGTSSTQKPEDYMGALEKYKEHCKAAVVSDSLFVPPSDIKFQDLSQLMKAVTKPSGTTGGVMTEEQIKALQKQFAPESSN